MRPLANVETFVILHLQPWGCLWLRNAEVVRIQLLKFVVYSVKTTSYKHKFCRNLVAHKIFVG